MLVREILKKKGHKVCTVEPDAKVYDALRLMADKEIGALLVTEKGKLCGIISERDYARKIILKGKASTESLVKDIMTSEVLYIDPNQTIEDCMEIVSDKHIRHIPVVENEKLVGLISIGDVVKALVEEKESVIKQLEQYINLLKEQLNRLSGS